MVRRSRAMFVAVLVAGLVALSSNGGARLKVALEDRADPNPRQVSLAVEMAGLCLGVVVSWSRRLGSVGDV